MHPALVRTLDRAIELGTSRRYLQHLGQLREMEHWSREQLEAFQLRKLADLLDHAQAHVPYWRRVLKGRGEELARPDRFRGIPFLTKDLFQEQGSALVDERGSPRRVKRSSTGGSTGKNIWFLVDLNAFDHRRAAVRLIDEWEDVRPGTRIVSLWGSPLDARRSRLSRMYDRLGNRLFLSAYGLDDAKVEEYAGRLLQFQPQVIVSYPSILLHFAQRLGRQRCRELHLQRIFSEAEALYPSVRSELEDLFGCRVCNRYGCREFGKIAAQCPESGVLHVVDSRFFVESISFDGGEPELVITDLDNAIQPFIRYRIHDSARILEGACSCGRPFTRLETVAGRSLDVIATPAGKAFGGTFFTLLLRPADQAIEQFQVVQEASDKIRVLVVPGPAWSPSRQAEIRAKLEAQLEGVSCLVQTVAEIPALASGKRRFVVGLTPGPR